MDKDTAERESLRFLQQSDLRSAAQAVRLYESRQPRPRGVGIDWTKLDTSDDEQMLRWIVESRPAILGNVSETGLQLLRVAAGMMYLWGTPKASTWIPSSIRGQLRLDPEVIVRMLIFAATTQRTLEQAKALNVSRVSVLAAPDSCSECMALSKKSFAVDVPPEIPHPACTHPLGCRCDVMADI